MFLALWHLGAQQINTSLGTFPGPLQVVEQWNNLVDEHQHEMQREQAYYDRQEQRNAAALLKTLKLRLAGVILMVESLFSIKY